MGDPSTTDTLGAEIGGTISFPDGGSTNGIWGGPLEIGDASIDLFLSVTYERIALNSPGSPSINPLDFYGDMIDKDTLLRGTFSQDTVFFYSGTEYPELNGTLMTAHALNYLGFGAALAAYEVPSFLVNPATYIYWNLYSGNPDPIDPNVYNTTQAGYNAFNKLPPY